MKQVSNASVMDAFSNYSQVKQQPMMMMAAPRMMMPQMPMMMP
jgi:hypothetical protein